MSELDVNGDFAAGADAGPGDNKTDSPTGSTASAASSRKPSRPELEADDDDDDDDKKGARERRKIEIKFIQDKSRRHITFSKRRQGIMKKAWELSVLTGTQVLLLVVSETGLVYTYTTPKLESIVKESEGRQLIQACLNAPDAGATEEAPSAGSADETPGTPSVAAATGPAAVNSAAGPAAGHLHGNLPPGGPHVGPPNDYRGPGGPGGPPTRAPGGMAPGYVPTSAASVAEHGIPGHGHGHGQPPMGLDPAMMMQQQEMPPQHLPDGYMPADYPGYMPQQRYN